MTQSPLLRLPGELRNKIFAYAVGGHIITVTLAPPCDSSESSDDEDDVEWVRHEDDDSYKYLQFRLATAAQPKPPIEPRSLGYHSRYHIVGGALDATHVSSIFTASRVCRQIYTETALLQYKTNYFHFDVPVCIDLFIKHLTSEQLQAIPTISIGDGYLIEEIFGPVCSITRELRKQFLGLSKIYLVPEIVEWTSAPTPREKLVKVARNLRLDIKENAGLWVGIFDVLDETAVIQDALGVTIETGGGIKDASTGPF
ncbi:hypothetical protein J4E80_007549 [Alternaria sp. BMP 0032]|nr:hypothetical protein J4E80_007549 [Alternaria sp. BMP 0032]